MVKNYCQKHELTFALIWILLYVSVVSPIRAKEGYGFRLLLALALLSALAVSCLALLGLLKKILFRKWDGSARQYLYFLPLFILSLGNLWGGIRMEGPESERMLAVLCMLLVGFLEEVIFRGLLFWALLKKDGALPAVIISAVTFGIGHIVNLLSGQTGPETFLQIFFAIGWGFLFTMTFYKSGSLLIPILVHGIINASSLFSKAEGTSAMNLFHIACVLVVAILYCLYLRRLKTGLSEDPKPGS